MVVEGCVDCQAGMAVGSGYLVVEWFEVPFKQQQCKSQKGLVVV